mmetsp:Transcript_5206/g.5950  ORF Transcript_5206/g.5950 Transcript_5206/m.5950 type:complete len:297 (+) Transcript_5206:418-1308(+)
MQDNEVFCPFSNVDEPHWSTFQIDLPGVNKVKASSTDIPCKKPDELMENPRPKLISYTCSFGPVSACDLQLTDDVFSCFENINSKTDLNEPLKQIDATPKPNWLDLEAALVYGQHQLAETEHIHQFSGVETKETKPEQVDLDDSANVKLPNKFQKVTSGREERVNYKHKTNRQPQLRSHHSKLENVALIGSYVLVRGEGVSLFGRISQVTKDEVVSTRNKFLQQFGVTNKRTPKKLWRHFRELQKLEREYGDREYFKQYSDAYRVMLAGGKVDLDSLPVLTKNAAEKILLTKLTPL